MARKPRGKTAEDRLRVLEDIHEIQVLKTRYLNASDGGWTGQQSHDGPLASSFFVKDATYQAKGFPKAVGPKQISALFKGYRKTIPIAMHNTANPSIRVKGDTAVGEWHLFGMFSDGKGSDRLVTGHYVDMFVRTPKGWRFQSLSCSFFFAGPYRDGWTRLVTSTHGKVTQQKPRATRTTSRRKR